jgi:hypothetical protein
MEEPYFKRLSITTKSGKVLMMTLQAKNLSAALEEELMYYRKAGQTPAEIIISREPGVMGA